MIKRILNWINDTFRKYENATVVARVGWGAFLTMVLRFYGVPTWLAIVLAGVVIGGFKEIVMDKVISTDVIKQPWGLAIRDTVWWVIGGLITILVRKW
jgi:hypothetical protein